jgi:bifunctional ADP-heptose synthase (sugar kinase/adenylyltransferase)
LKRGPVEGEIDIVGAGDSVMASVVSALCSGADPTEAALLGNIVASITVQQIGTTGTASRKQVRERFADLEDLVRTGIIAASEAGDLSKNEKAKRGATKG